MYNSNKNQLEQRIQDFIDYLQKLYGQKQVGKFQIDQVYQDFNDVMSQCAKFVEMEIQMQKMLIHLNEMYHQFFLKHLERKPFFDYQIKNENYTQFVSNKVKKINLNDVCTEQKDFKEMYQKIYTFCQFSQQNQNFQSYDSKGQIEIADFVCNYKNFLINLFEITKKENNYSIIQKQMQKLPQFQQYFQKLQKLQNKEILLDQKTVNDLQQCYLLIDDPNLLEIQGENLDFFIFNDQFKNFFNKQLIKSQKEITLKIIESLHDKSIRSELSELAGYDTPSMYYQLEGSQVDKNIYETLSQFQINKGPQKELKDKNVIQKNQFQTFNQKILQQEINPIVQKQEIKPKKYSIKNNLNIIENHKQKTNNQFEIHKQPTFTQTIKKTKKQFEQNKNHIIFQKKKEAQTQGYEFKQKSSKRKVQNDKGDAKKQSTISDESVKNNLELTDLIYNEDNQVRQGSSKIFTNMLQQQKNSNRNFNISQKDIPQKSFTSLVQIFYNQKITEAIKIHDKQKQQKCMELKSSAKHNLRNLIKTAMEREQQRFNIANRYQTLNHKIIQKPQKFQFNQSKRENHSEKLDIVYNKSQRSQQTDSQYQNNLSYRNNQLQRSSIDKLKDETGSISKVFQQVPLTNTEKLSKDFKDTQNSDQGFQITQKKQKTDSEILINGQVYDSIDDSDFDKNQEDSQSEPSEAGDEYSEISDQEEMKSDESNDHLQQTTNQDGSQKFRQSQSKHQLSHEKVKDLKDTLFSKDDSKKNDVPQTIQQKIEYKQLRMIQMKFQDISNYQKQQLLQKILSYIGLEYNDAYPQLEELNFVKFQDKEEHDYQSNPIIQANRHRIQEYKIQLQKKNEELRQKEEIDAQKQNTMNTYQRTGKVQFVEDEFDPKIKNYQYQQKNDEDEENQNNYQKTNKFQLTKPLGIRIYDNQQDNENLSTESEDIEKEIVINNDYRKFLLAQDSEQYINDQGPVNLKQNYEGFIQEYFVNDSKSFQNQIPSFIVEKFIDNEFPPVLASVSEDVEHGFLQIATGYVEWRRVSDVFEQIKELDTSIQYDTRAKYLSARSNLFIEIFVQAIYEKISVGSQLVNLEYDREKGIIKVTIPLMQTAVYLDDFLPINLIVNELSGMEDIKFLFINPTLGKKLNFFCSFIEKFFAKIFGSYEELQYKSLEDLLSIFQFEDSKFQEIDFATLDKKQKLKKDFFQKIQDIIQRPNQLLFLKDDCDYFLFREYQRMKDFYCFVRQTHIRYFNIQDIIDSKKKIIILKILD